MARPFTTTHPLGQRMKELGLRVQDVTIATGINARQLSNLLANRTPLRGRTLHLLADFLDIDPDDLLPATPSAHSTTAQYVHSFPSQADRPK